MIGLTGAQPQDVSDAFSMLENLDAIKEAKKEAGKQYKKYFRMALENKDSPADFSTYFGLAKDYLISGGFDPLEEQRLLADAVASNRRWLILSSSSIQNFHQKHCNSLFADLQGNKING
jgi:hypothetical protein